MSLFFEFTLSEHGWADAVFGDDSRRVDLTASYCTDALGDLVRAARRALTGRAAQCSWDAEPEEYRWLFVPDGDTTTVTILRFDDAYAELPLEDGGLLFSANASAIDVAQTIERSVRSVLDKYGMGGYRRRWVRHSFPRKDLDELRAAIRVAPLGCFVDGTFCLEKQRAELLAERINTIASRTRPENANSFGSLDVYEWKPGRYGVSYRNADEGLWWELTDATPELGAGAIRRWDFPNYRALRRAFEALLASVPEYTWLEPQLDRIEVTERPMGVLSIDETAPGEFRLLWRPTGDPTHELDLSTMDTEAAVRTLFGDKGVVSLRAAHSYDGELDLS